MTHFGATFDAATKRERLDEVLAELGQPDVWNEPDRAQELGKEKARLEATLEPLEQSLSGLDDAEELLELAADEQDDE